MTNAYVIRDERDKFRAAAVDSLFMRLGHKVPKPAAGYDELGSFTLGELSRECLKKANQPTNGSTLEMVGRAMTASDFPYLLAAGANKSLVTGFNTASETWNVWCGTGNAPDFKTLYLMRPGETDDLDEVPEATEYKYGSRTETRESVQVVTYGKLFAITRQAIINDDLSALADTPAAHGEAAARKIGDIAYAVLTANGTMNDGIALFDASTHANYVASGSAPGIATLSAGEASMALRTDLSGKRRLNIQPQFFLSPYALKGACDVFFNSPYYSDSNAIATDSSLASTRTNPWSGRLLQVYDARLDSASTTAWYLAGARGKTVTVYFLNGVQTPYLESRDGFTTDGVEYKVRIDAGALAVDYRALYCNNGA